MTQTNIAEAPEMFQAAVNRLATRPAFLAHVFATAFGGDVSAKRIAAELQCSETNALRIAMMTVPRSDGQLFRDDMARIASAAGVDYGLLFSVIKQAQVLAVFDHDGKGAGMLLAARDVVPDAEDHED
jgi:ABC-type uncharacterized transport system ATPase subunit